MNDDDGIGAGDSIGTGKVVAMEGVSITCDAARLRWDLLWIATTQSEYSRIRCSNRLVISMVDAMIERMLCSLPFALRPCV